jgi:hypothetical protein
MGNHPVPKKKVNPGKKISFLDLLLHPKLYTSCA